MPDRPAPGKPRPDAAKANYAGDLHDAWADCHDTVAATAQRKADYAKQYKQATEPAWQKLIPHFGKKD